MEKKVIITLGRQYGSGGRLLGKRLAELLGIDFYDRELLSEVSKRSGLDEGYLARHDEKAPGFFDYALAGRVGASQLFGSSQNFICLTETLRGLATDKSCLIVGRTADYILREEPNLIRLFVHAPYLTRIRNVMRRHKCTAEQADAAISRFDKERARFYEFFTDKTWGEADTYDLTLDISRLGEEGSAQFLANYVRMRMEKFK